MKNILQKTIIKITIHRSQEDIKNYNELIITEINNYVSKKIRKEDAVIIFNLTSMA